MQKDETYEDILGYEADAHDAMVAARDATVTVRHILNGDTHRETTAGDRLVYQLSTAIRLLAVVAREHNAELEGVYVTIDPGAITALTELDQDRGDMFGIDGVTDRVGRPPEHSDRARYVTDQVATWIVNDGKHFDRAKEIAESSTPTVLGLSLTDVMHRASGGSAPWQVAQELAPNDYGRIDWREVAHQLSD